MKCSLIISTDFMASSVMQAHSVSYAVNLSTSELKILLLKRILNSVGLTREFILNVKNWFKVLTRPYEKIEQLFRVVFSS